MREFFAGETRGRRERNVPTLPKTGEGWGTLEIVSVLVDSLPATDGPPALKLVLPAKGRARAH